MIEDKTLEKINTKISKYNNKMRGIREFLYSLKEEKEIVLRSIIMEKGLPTKYKLICQDMDKSYDSVWLKPKDKKWSKEIYEMFMELGIESLHFTQYGFSIAYIDGGYCIRVRNGEMLAKFMVEHGLTFTYPKHMYLVLNERTTKRSRLYRDKLYRDKSKKVSYSDYSDTRKMAQSYRRASTLIITYKEEQLKKNVRDRVKQVKGESQ